MQVSFAPHVGRKELTVAETENKPNEIGIYLLEGKLLKTSFPT